MKNPSKHVVITESLEDMKNRHQRELKELEEKLKIVSDMPIPRIEVVDYTGKAGGFATKTQTMYRCDIINVSGVRERFDGYGYTQIKYAEDDAKAWANRTGCPIFYATQQ